MTTETTRGGTYVQWVRVEYELVIEEGNSGATFDDTTRDDLQDAAERYVRKEIIGQAQADGTTSIRSWTGPSNPGFHYPGQPLRTGAPRPIRVTLADLIPPHHISAAKARERARAEEKR